MPGQINRLPDGILGFLGIKNFGRGPDTLDSVLSGTWDLRDWYLNTNVSYQTSSLTAIALGGSLVFTAPTNELWWVTNLSIFHNAAAASSNTTALCRFGQRTADQVILSESGRVTALQANQFGITQPFILGAGETLGYSCAELTGTGQVQMFIRYRQMQV